MKLLIILLTFLITSTGYSAVISRLKGKAFFEGKPLKLNSTFDGDGKLTTGENSHVKITHEGSTILLGANSEMMLKKNASEAPGFTKGLMRWVSGKVTKSGPTVTTANAIFGVRGTDFLVVYNELLGESEIICFSGEVDFNSGNKTVTIKKNQWGGVGGRFGSEIGKILDLPGNVITHFNAALPE